MIYEYEPGVGYVYKLLKESSKDNFRDSLIMSSLNFGRKKKLEKKKLRPRKVFFLVILLVYFLHF